MRLLRLSSAVLSFLEPLSEKCVLSVSYLGLVRGTLYKQKGLCSTSPTAVPISKERGSLRPCHLPETLASEDLRFSFPNKGSDQCPQMSKEKHLLCASISVCYR